MPRKAYLKHMIWGAGVSLLALGLSAQVSANSYGANSYGANSYGANSYGANNYAPNGFSGQGYAPQGQAYGGGAYGGGDVYGHDAYQGRAFQGGAFQGGAHSGQSGCQGPSGFQGGNQRIKSRYGVWQESYQVSCQMGGYWVYPQQYVAEPPIIQHRIIEETPAPLPAPAPIVVTQDCPVGQYWTHDGHCSGLNIEPVRETYVPPSIPQSYPAPAAPLPNYVLPRK